MQVEKDNLPCSDFADRTLYVVREKGEWEPVLNERGQQYNEEIYENVWRCPVCGEETFRRNFCPNCGSDMRKVENDDV
jgi:rubrerythrin